MQYEIPLNTNFLCRPSVLTEVQKSVPVDDNNRVPLDVFGRTFEKAHPTIEEFGAQAVRFSLEKPFGFFASRGESPEQDLESQLMPAVTLKMQETSLWVAVAELDAKPTDTDTELIAKGMSRYIRFALRSYRNSVEPS